MANPEHLGILKQGVDAWNTWTANHTATKPDLSGADLRGADLGTAHITGANLYPAILTGANLRGANLEIAYLRGAYLTGADLSNANLRAAHLQEADLRDADVSGAQLQKANLTRAYLRRADLRGSDLGGADLWEATLSEAILNNASFFDAVVGRTIFGACDLSAVGGLETVRHGGPSSVGIDTIYLSKGNIPEAFLRGAGVLEDFIVYMRSLTANPIEFYSCFISYSSKDEEFARRLHADLQQANVRCWFAPEDLKIGDKFRTHIDESIRLYDKLMVILTENSIASSWVEEEAEAALEKERKSGRLVLFPIRLDDAVMETHQPWAASLRRTRHIGDFRNWKDHDAFKRAFERLLRDLKSSG